MARQEEVAHDRMGKMAAEWRRVGLERPTTHFGHGTVCKSGVAPAQQENSFGARRENLGETGAEGKDYTLHLRLHLFLHPVERAISLRRVACRRQCNQKSPWKKAPDWAGATPLFRLSAAQKVRVVAPARYAGSVTVFCPSAKRELLRKANETIFPWATHRSRLELERLVGANVTFLRDTNG
jgi:hypothetical protein